MLATLSCDVNGCLAKYLLSRSLFFRFQDNNNNNYNYNYNNNNLIYRADIYKALYRFTVIKVKTKYKSMH